MVSSPEKGVKGKTRGFCYSLGESRTPPVLPVRSWANHSLIGATPSATGEGNRTTSEGLRKMCKGERVVIIWALFFLISGAVPSSTYCRGTRGLRLDVLGAQLPSTAGIPRERGSVKSTSEDKARRDMGTELGSAVSRLLTVL